MGTRKGKYQLIDEQIARERAEREAREALLPPKIGINPRKPHHPVWNPSQEEIDRWNQSLLDSLARKQTPSQEQHWRAAIRLIRTGTVLSYADLGQRFKLTEYERARQGSRGSSRECFSAAWAYHLVRKMIVRHVFTLEDVQRLIPDTTSPFNNRKRKSPQQPSTTI